MDFCPVTFMLLQPVTTTGELMFKSTKTGNIYKSTDENTMLASEETSGLLDVLKYKNTLNVTAFDPTNPRIRVPGGCSECGRSILSFQRFGEDKKVSYACICGNGQFSL